jgi:uncharacterized protein YjbI with pentapeptide repeats
MAEWNQWRQDHPEEEVLLEGARLRRAYLEGAMLNEGRLAGADLWGAQLKGVMAYEADLEGASLAGADLEGATLAAARLDGADLQWANLKGAYLLMARLDRAALCRAGLERADLSKAHLEGADLSEARLEGAVLNEAHVAGAKAVAAHLENTQFIRADLDGANLSYAYLEGADLRGASLKGTRFTAATVAGGTLFWNCAIDRRTDFTGVGLGSARVEPGLRQLLEFNVRCLGWNRWCRKGAWWERVLKTASVGLFWMASNYGHSTLRITGVFAAATVLFAAVYTAFPGLLATEGGQVRGFVHALYFSVITMTTLGFGDIHANPESCCGQVLVMIQVLLGYILLGALVTRFAVLFTSGGPAERFPDERRTRERALDGLRCAARKVGGLMRRPPEAKGK